MSNSLAHWLNLFIFATASSLSLSAGLTQANPDPAHENRTEEVPSVKHKSIPDIFDKAFFNRTGDFFQQITIENQLLHFLGVEYFDIQIADDSHTLTTLYQDIMKQQYNSSPPIRTRDLNNPYNSSLMENPDYTRTGSSGLK